VNERVAVVTGGAGAIAGAIVHALGAAGLRTVVLDRDECDLETWRRVQAPGER
jgi:NAD(P)-dependent dehydrogenase (short-subunit alcohol dehydrogenase family)